MGASVLSVGLQSCCWGGAFDSREQWFPAPPPGFQSPLSVLYCIMSSRKTAGKGQMWSAQYHRAELKGELGDERQ